MSIDITMPALSPTMEEGNLAKWLVKEGDQVAPGDVIAEIETDKATMEVEAVEEGTVAKILVAEGSEGVKVNAVIAVLAEEGEDVGKAAAGQSSPPKGAPDPAPGDQANGSNTETIAQSPATDQANQSDANATPLAHRVAGQQGVALEAVSGTGAKGKIVMSDVVAASAGATPELAGGDRIFASPLARKSAQEAGLELTLITGSGPAGRIVRKDVDAALAAGAARSAPPVAQPTPVSPAAFAMPDDAVLKLYQEDTYTVKQHDAMRRIIAQRLTESSQSIPVYMLTVDCGLDTLLGLRAAMNAAAPVDENGKPTYKISVNDFIVKAMALALQRVPMANASWTSQARIIHNHSDVGVAVAIPDGLLTPIVRKAEQKSLSTISAEVKDMAGRARNKKLLPHEYQGGSTAVSNLGMFGVKEFTSIINPPHASIVSIGAGEKRPIVKDGELAIATQMSATFAFDHRVIDGALGAELAASFKGFIEQPAGMLV